MKRWEKFTTVAVERLLEEKRHASMFFRQLVAEGEAAGRKFTVSSIIPSGGLLVEFDKAPGDKTILGRDRFILRTDALMQAILNKLAEEK